MDQGARRLRQGDILETVLYYSQSNVKARAVTGTLAAAGAAAGALAAGAATGATAGLALVAGGLAAGAVAAVQQKRRGRRADEQSIDERLRELLLVGDVLRDSTTGRQPDARYSKFGDARFWQRLRVLYRRNNPAFSNSEIPLYH